MSQPDVPSIDESLVRRLLERQFPQWAGLPLQAVASAGTDHAIFRLGDGLVVRLPKRESAAPQAEREQQWLPRLAASLPLAIPAPVVAGRPGAGYPWAWSVCAWLDGADAVADPLSDLVQAGRDLAGFLVALKRVDATGGPLAGAANNWRGAPLAALDARVHRDVATLGGEIDGAAVLQAWDEALAAPAHGAGGMWVHGDLHASNLLVRRGRIVAVLDFGLMGVGDPACDLFVAWSVLDAAGRTAFRELLEVDDAAWLRGRGWAIFNAVIALAFYLRTNPTLCGMSRRTLAQVLA